MRVGNIWNGRTSRVDRSQVAAGRQKGLKTKWNIAASFEAACVHKFTTELGTEALFTMDHIAHNFRGYSWVSNNGDLLTSQCAT
jgi:hypothetical protein